MRPTASGTSIRWHGTYTTRPGLEAFPPDFLGGFMKQLADGLATQATEVARD